MIDYIKGIIAELNPAYAVIDNHGIGYMLNISLSTYDALTRTGQGSEALLYVHEAIREDAHLLYGFATKKERAHPDQKHGPGTRSLRSIPRMKAPTVKMRHRSTASGPIL